MRAAGPAAARVAGRGARRGERLAGLAGASGGRARVPAARGRIWRKREEGGVRKREKTRIWLDLRAIII